MPAPPILVWPIKYPTLNSSGWLSQHRRTAPGPSLDWLLLSVLTVCESSTPLSRPRWALCDARFVRHHLQHARHYSDFVPRHLPHHHTSQALPDLAACSTTRCHHHSGGSQNCGLTFSCSCAGSRVPPPVHHHPPEPEHVPVTCPKVVP